jgi:putative transposase
MDKKTGAGCWLRKVWRLMAYPSSLTDTQWQVIEKELEVEMVSRKRLRPLRSIIDAIFYVNKGGISWRMMPLDLPPWQTVYYYYRSWRQNGFWQWLHDLRNQKVRRKQGKEASPSVAIMESQSVKTCQMGGQRGYDPAKRIKGRKRHLLVDTLGLLIVLLVHRADIEERQGAKYLLNRLLKRIIDFKRLKVFFADQGYSGQKMQDWVAGSPSSYKPGPENKSIYKTVLIVLFFCPYNNMPHQALKYLFKISDFISDVFLLLLKKSLGAIAAIN